MTNKDAKSTASDQTNAEVSAEQLREPVFWISSKQMPTPVQGGYVAARAAPEGNFDTPLYTDINRRSVTSQASEGAGWVYFNEDSGEEYSPSHPVESGECEDATDIRRSTLQEDHLWAALQEEFQRAENAPVSKRVERLETAAQAVFDWWQQDVQDDSPELHALFEALDQALQGGRS